MKSFKKLSLAAVALCSILLGTINTASATQKKKTINEFSKAQLQLAYAQLIKKPQLKKSIIKRKHNQAHFRAIATAKKQIRKRYRWGGSTPRTGFDCSGLTQYAFKSANIKIPRTAAAQYKYSKRVSLSKIQAGDLIFFHTRRTRARVNHVGIYLGNGKFIHAPRRGKRVSIAKLNKYWQRKAVGAGRV